MCHPQRLDAPTWPVLPISIWPNQGIFANLGQWSLGLWFQNHGLWWPVGPKIYCNLETSKSSSFPVSEQPEAKVASCFCASWISFCWISFCRIWFFFQAWLAGHIKSSMKFGEFAPLTHVSPLISHDIPIRYPYKISIDIPFYQHFSLWNPHSVL